MQTEHDRGLSKTTLNNHKRVFDSDDLNQGMGKVEKNQTITTTEESAIGVNGPDVLLNSSYGNGEIGSILYDLRGLSFPLSEGCDKVSFKFGKKSFVCVSHTGKQLTNKMFALFTENRSNHERFFF